MGLFVGEPRNDEIPKTVELLKRRFKTPRNVSIRYLLRNKSHWSLEVCTRYINEPEFEVPQHRSITCRIKASKFWGPSLVWLV